MKKIMTLLFCAALVSKSFAQTSTNEAARNREIAQARSEFKAQLVTISRNPATTTPQKGQLQRQAYQQEVAKINAINSKYGYKNNAPKTTAVHNTVSYTKKHDNGKHLGWQKGEGNQHGNDQDLKRDNKDEKGEKNNKKEND